MTRHSGQNNGQTDLDYLTSKAGDTPVLVEPMHPESKQFGTDIERVSMPFREFLGTLRSDAEVPPHYLTTQYAEEDGDAEKLFSPPTNALRDDVPRVPRLMGNLFLQQVNLWLGKSKDGCSSGLHHDFHDNLYCLLAGKKRFVLLPPASAHYLYPHGKLDTIHPNGLISYLPARLRADGLSPRVAAAARVRALERRLAVLPKRRKGKERADTAAWRALEDALDDARDQLAQETLESGDVEGEVDDFDALMGGLEGSDIGSVRGAGSVEGSVADEEEEPLGSEGDGHEDSEPQSFSRIPTSVLHKHLGLPTTAALPSSAISADMFPDLAKTEKPYIVELSAGEMLYLPASWWHEVTSSSVPTDTATGESAVHMAFNWWFYPPDAKDRFDEPYKDELIWGYLREKVREGATGVVEGKRKATDEDMLSGKKAKT